MASAAGRRTSWGAVIAASALLHGGVAFALLQTHFRGEAEPGPERTISLVFVEQPTSGNALPQTEAVDERPLAPPAPETVVSVAEPLSTAETVSPATETIVPAAVEPPTPAVVPAARHNRQPPQKPPVRSAARKPASDKVSPEVAAPAHAPVPMETSQGTPAATVVASLAAPVETRPLGITREAVPILTPAPAYPAVARRRGIEGEVVVAIRIDEEGRPATVSIEESSGVPALDAAALKASESWRFSPALKDGHRIATEIRKPIRFRLAD